MANSPAALVSWNGAAVQERYEYDAYGKAAITARGADNAWYTADDVTLTASAYHNPFTFTGRQLDILDAGSLHYMHYRYRDYSPQLGRFIQHDPLLYIEGLNGYDYVVSNPLSATDPSGLCSRGVLDYTLKSLGKFDTRGFCPPFFTQVGQIIMDIIVNQKPEQKVLWDTNDCGCEETCQLEKGWSITQGDLIINANVDFYWGADIVLGKYQLTKDMWHGNKCTVIITDLTVSAKLTTYTGTCVDE